MLGIFNTEDELIDGLENMKKEGLRFREVYTPYPIHEVFQILERKSRFITVAWFLGFFGAAAVLAFLYYTSVISWPINYGGKPFNAFPSFIVITIVLTIFIVTIGSLFIFSVRANLYPGNEHQIPDPRITDDKFVVVIEPGAAGNPESKEIKNLLEKNGASEIIQKE